MIYYLTKYTTENFTAKEAALEDLKRFDPTAVLDKNVSYLLYELRPELLTDEKGVKKPPTTGDVLVIGDIILSVEGVLQKGLGTIQGYELVTRRLKKEKFGDHEFARPSSD